MATATKAGAQKKKKERALNLLLQYDRRRPSVVSGRLFAITRKKDEICRFTELFGERTGGGEGCSSPLVVWTVSPGATGEGRLNSHLVLPLSPFPLPEIKTVDLTCVRRGSPNVRGAFTIYASCLPLSRFHLRGGV